MVFKPLLHNSALVCRLNILNENDGLRWRERMVYTLEYDFIKQLSVNTACSVKDEKNPAILFPYLINLVFTYSLIISDLQIRRVYKK